MRSTLPCILVLAAGLIAPAQVREEPPFELPAGVRVERDLVYARIGARDLHLDLYLPSSAAGRIPAVVYIHGGGWQNGNKGAFRRQAAHMAANGFAGACVEYRLSGEAKFPAAVHDSKAAVRWVRSNAARYGIDPDRIGAAGGSAGGHLAAMLGTTAGVADLEGDAAAAGASSSVRAVAAFNPALDFVAFAKSRTDSGGYGAVLKFLGVPYASRPELWAHASPITHVSRHSAPILLLHGSADRTVPYQQSLDLKKKYEDAGARVELFTADGAAHGFFNRPPWFEPTLRRMEEFFRAALLK